MIAPLLATAIASYVAVGVFRSYAIRHSVLDHANDRSSHTGSVPRGGGVGLIASVLIVFIIADRMSIDWPLGVALVGVMPTLVVGWLDDHRSLDVGPRLAAHILSAVLMVPLAVQGRPLDATTVLIGCAIIFVSVAAINVINFMDGIDALIALQTVVFAAHLAVLSGGDGPPRLLAVIVGAGAIGFLGWNWPPARIFLGDVGSGALALVCLIAGLLTWRLDSWTFLAVFTPLIPLFLDATLTLARRLGRGEDVSLAHRTHLYQRLANEAGWGHAAVSLSYAAAAAAGSATVIAAHGSALAITTYAVVVAVTGLLLSRRQARSRYSPTASRG